MSTNKEHMLALIAELRKRFGTPIPLLELEELIEALPNEPELPSDKDIDDLWQGANGPMGR